MNIITNIIRIAFSADGSEEKESLAVGGQAVIEGIMIRSPHKIATAVRRKNGEIEIDSYPYIPFTKRNKLLGKPVIRGAVSLFEAMIIGIRALNWSAEKFAEDEGDGTPRKERWYDSLVSALSILAALAFGMGLFMLIPYYTSGFIRDAGGSQLAFHAVAGFIRISIFLLYLYAISLWKDVQRVFEYHGAEHKNIFAFEKNGEVDSKSAASESRFHPRCGTSFLLITAVVIILFFAVIDSLLIPIIGEFKTAFHRFAIHLPFIPLVAGISYEVLKYSGKRSKGKFWGTMVKPGLWLQRITTREPDISQLEVGAAAIKASLSKGSM